MDSCRRQFLAGFGAALSRSVHGWAAEQGSAYLRLSPSRASPGQRVEIQWAAPEGSHVHLLGWGQVASSGRKLITAGAAFSSVVLVAETPAGIEIHEATLELIGVRDFPPPKPQAYRYPYAHQLPPYQKYGAMLDSIVSAVQTKLKGVQQQFQSNKMLVYIQTNYLHPPELQIGLPPPYYGRRVAYLIEAPGPEAFHNATAVDITIRSLIEFRRRVEPKWYPEDDERLYRAATLQLASILGPI